MSACASPILINPGHASEQRILWAMSVLLGQIFPRGGEFLCYLSLIEQTAAIGQGGTESDPIGQETDHVFCDWTRHSSGRCDWL